MNPDSVTDAAVIIPVYDGSELTLDACLDSLAKQTFTDFEVILVDSSQHYVAQEAQAGRDLDLTIIRHHQRLLPHAARIVGVSNSHSPLLVFTDPDIVAAPDWLEQIVSAYRSGHRAIVGAVDCSQPYWLERGIHLSKFDLWLPRNRSTGVDIALTANMACDRDLYDSLGGLPGDWMLGDTVFSWRLAEAAIRVRFVPEAVVDHIHVADWKATLKERFLRGREFGQLRISYFGWSRWRVVWQLSLTPLRVIGLLARIGNHAARSGWLNSYLATFPVILTAQIAWLGGEGAAYLHHLQAGSEAVVEVSRRPTKTP